MNTKYYIVTLNRHISLVLNVIYLRVVSSQERAHFSTKIRVTMACLLTALAHNRPSPNEYFIPFYTIIDKPFYEHI